MLMGKSEPFAALIISPRITQNFSHAVAYRNYKGKKSDQFSSIFRLGVAIQLTSAKISIFFTHMPRAQSNQLFDLVIGQMNNNDVNKQRGH